MKLDINTLPPCTPLQSPNPTTAVSGSGCNTAGFIGEIDTQIEMKSSRLRTCSGSSLTKDGAISATSEGTACSSVEPYERLRTVLRMQQGSSLEGVDIGASKPRVLHRRPGSPGSQLPRAWLTCL